MPHAKPSTTQNTYTLTDLRDVLSLSSPSLSLPTVCPFHLPLAEYLPDPKELDLYMSMADDDGWCRHFDKKNRACTIYNDRPRFCRVETETFGSMYGVDPEDMDDFCSACCHEQINDVYGSKRRVGVMVMVAEVQPVLRVFFPSVRLHQAWVWGVCV